MKDYFELLDDITKSNVCCKIVQSFYNHHHTFECLSKFYFSTKKLAIKLDVMVRDIKEYLLERKSKILSHHSNQYLSNSISYMKACKKHKSNSMMRYTNNILIKNNMRILHYKATTEEENSNNSIKFMNTKYKKNDIIQNIEKLDSKQSTQLRKVNDYYKKENKLVSEYINKISSIHIQTESKRTHRDLDIHVLDRSDNFPSPNTEKTKVQVDEHLIDKYHTVYKSSHDEI